MSDRPDFTIEVHQNPYLPVNGQEVHAVVQVDAVGGPAAQAARSTAAAEVIIIDTSTSMAGERLVAAKRAAKTAVDSLREGVDFAVISGCDKATMVYPPNQVLAPATGENRAAARSAIARLPATGGTRIGTWLALAGKLFADHQQGIRHATLLTDGKNEHENREELDEALANCAGRFVCDCRGIGADWEPAELRRVATVLLGGFGMVADPRDLTADFADMIERVMGKAVADVVLRIWTPRKALLRSVTQMYPSIRDLSDGSAETGSSAARSNTGDYPTGIWGTERRDYYLWVTVPARKPDQEMLAAEVSIVLPGSAGTSEVILAADKVLANWTDDEAQSTRLHFSVEHYSKQQALADSVQKARKAYEDGDLKSAAAEFRRVRDLAEQTGRKDILRWLDRLVDPETGEVRPRTDVNAVDVNWLDTESSESAQPPGRNPPPAAED